MSILVTLVEDNDSQGHAYECSSSDLIKVIDNGSVSGSQTSKVTLSDGSTINVALSKGNITTFRYGFHAVQQQTFTGTTQWADGNRKDFQSGNTSNIVYKIQGYGSGSNYQLGKGQFLLYIPTRIQCFICFRRRVTRLW